MLKYIKVDTTNRDRLEVNIPLDFSHIIEEAGANNSIHLDININLQLPDSQGIGTWKVLHYDNYGKCFSLALNSASYRNLSKSH